MGEVLARLEAKLARLRAHQRDAVLARDHELDAVGPYAQRMLRGHGLVGPFNAHFHLPLIDAARGGSLLTGIGGDELHGGADFDFAHYDTAGPGLIVRMGSGAQAGEALGDTFDAVEGVVGSTA